MVDPWRHFCARVLSLPFFITLTSTKNNYKWAKKHLMQFHHSTKVLEVCSLDIFFWCAFNTVQSNPHKWKPDMWEPRLNGTTLKKYVLEDFFCQILFKLHFPLILLVQTLSISGFYCTCSNTNQSFLLRAAPTAAQEVSHEPTAVVFSSSRPHVLIWKRVCSSHIRVRIVRTTSAYKSLLVPASGSCMSIHPSNHSM